MQRLPGSQTQACLCHITDNSVRTKQPCYIQPLLYTNIVVTLCLCFSLCALFVVGAQLCFAVVNVEIVGEVQTPKLFLEYFDIFGIYFSTPRELQDISSSDVPVPKCVCPQQAVRASVQEISFVVRQILAKSGGKSRHCCIHLPQDTPIEAVISPT